MKLSLTIFGVLFTFLSYGQASNDTIEVIAKLVSPGQGSKIHIAKYRIVKTIKGKVTNDIIQVGYYFYNEYKDVPDTALLTLIKNAGNTSAKDYLIDS